MATKKPVVYTLSDMCKAAHAPQSYMLKVFKSIGIAPVSEMATGRITYRLYDQAAMDKLVLWRKSRDALQRSAQVPEPAPVVTPAMDSDVTRMVQRLDTLAAQMDAGGRYLLDTVQALNADVGALKKTLDQILDAVTTPTAVLNGAVHEAVAAGPDDRQGY